MSRATEEQMLNDLVRHREFVRKTVAWAKQLECGDCKELLKDPPDPGYGYCQVHEQGGVLRLLESAQTLIGQKEMQAIK